MERGRGEKREGMGGDEMGGREGVIPWLVILVPVLFQNISGSGYPTTSLQETFKRLPSKVT